MNSQNSGLVSSFSEELDEQPSGISPNLTAIDALTSAAQEDFRALQRPGGEWLFELEPDATISSEYILLQHFLGDLGANYRQIEPKIAKYLRGLQGDHGGWPLFHDGEMDISASVKAYWALKLAGDDPDADHMRRARDAILTQGGAAQANVFTRISLALFGEVPWRAVPVMPLQIMQLPERFPFHLSKVSYWSRTVIVPLLIIMHFKPRGKNPRGITIRELFLEDPEKCRYNMNPRDSRLGSFFAAADKVLRTTEPLLKKIGEKGALNDAISFVTQRLNGEDGLGGIYPAMANTVMAFDCLGYPRTHPDFVTAMNSVDRLLVFRGESEVYCQPCLSPIWDTCLGIHALLEAGEDPKGQCLDRAFKWLLEREIVETRGDWVVRRPHISPGGWAFQYQNAFYPDVDDTAVVVMAMHRADNPNYKEAIQRATDWIIGMQSSNGGWGAFEPENTHYHLNHIPFADHGALLDPPTVDVSARCIAMLAQLGYDRDHPAVAKGIAYLKKEQEADGSWYGRWGVNYVYGTWSALGALNAVGEPTSSPIVQRAVGWLKARQRDDGGWGEDCATYWIERRDECKESTPSQTAWALLGLMAAGELDSEAVARGVRYLEAHPRNEIRWDEAYWTGIGFPRVFYLKYHGYAAYFPLWALARYRNLRRANEKRVQFGI
ncbi:MAG: squalene--hopene cyclase [Pseudomonadota bacterium]